MTRLSNFLSAVAIIMLASCESKMALIPAGGESPTTGEVAAICEVNSVILTAMVQANGLETNVVFDYGMTPSSLTNSVSASPNLLSDTAAATVTAKVAGLEANSTYYFRVRADNSGGSAVSTVISAKTYAAMDVDSNFYTCVTIGTQTWLVENLKATRYNDGAPIPYIFDKDVWKDGLNGKYVTDACCFYNNDSIKMESYGVLYNGYAVQTGKLAPRGWHVPSQAEVDSLKAYLAADDSGGKLKESGTTHWQDPNVGATNSTGFTARPGGIREGGRFKYLEQTAYYWVTTEVIKNMSFSMTLNCLDSKIGQDISPWSEGLSVRCIKD